MTEQKKKRTVIGFYGPAGSGKSTAADILVASYAFRLVSFSAPIKEAMKAIGLTEEEINGSKKEHPTEKLLWRSPRYAMQTFGTEWGRNLIHPDIWIELWRRKVSSLPDNIPVVCDDVRFPNEADAIHSLGGVIVRISRPTVTFQSNHPSEEGKIIPDFVVENNTTEWQLAKSVTEIAVSMLVNLQEV